MRFDEMELEAVPLEIEVEGEAEVPSAPWFRRLLALLTDLSLFAALTLALAPLLPPAPSWMAIAALAGFVVVMSFYYFVGTWMLWSKTIGGAIFDVKSPAASLVIATKRWLLLVVTVCATGGAVFLAIAFR